MNSRSGQERAVCGTDGAMLDASIRRHAEGEMLEGIINLLKVHYNLNGNGNNLALLELIAQSDHVEFGQRYDIIFVISRV